MFVIYHNLEQINNKLNTLAEHIYLDDSVVQMLYDVDDVSNEFVEEIVKSHKAVKLNNKYILQHPLLLFTYNNEIIEELTNLFIFELRYDIPDITELIISGLLPLSNYAIDSLYDITSNNDEPFDEHIIDLPENDIDESKINLIFSLFQTLGYVKLNEYDYNNEDNNDENNDSVENSENVDENNQTKYYWFPTEKLIDAIIDDYPVLGNSLKIVMNESSFYISKQSNLVIITKAILEALKLIDNYIVDYVLNM